MSRISPGTVIVGIFAVLFGLVGAYAVRKSLQRPEQQVEAPQLNVVPVASIDLIPGRTLSVGDIAIMRLTAEQVRERGLPEGYMTNSQQIIGRTLREPLKQGQPFMTTDLYPEGMGPSVAERLKPGLRAVTVPIANTAAVAGMATPGSFVDVLFRTDSSFGGEELAQTTITLLESVEVLAFGQNILPGTRPPNRPQAQDTVTLAVSPEQAAALKVVEDRGDLMLTLRGPADLEYISDPQPLTLDSLLGLAAAPPPATTEIYRGTNKETMSFLSEEPPMTRITARPVRPGFVPAPRTSQPVGTEPVTRPAVAPTEPPPTKPASGPTEIPSAAQPQVPAVAQPPAGEPAAVPVPPPLTSQTSRPRMIRVPSAAPVRPARSTASSPPAPRTPQVAASRWAIPGERSADQTEAPQPSAASESAASAASESTTPRAAISSEVPPAPVAPPVPVAEVQRAAEPPAEQPLGEKPAAGTTSAVEPAPKPFAVAQRRFVTEVFSGTRTSHRVFQDGNLVEELEGKPGAAGEGEASTSPVLQPGKSS